MKTKPKTLTIKDGNRERPVSFQMSRYASNGNLYVGLFDYSGEEPEFLFDITVNLDKKCEPDCSFVDINNWPNVDKWLMYHGFANPTMEWESSGFCWYPEFRFNIEKLHEYGEEF